MQAGVPFNANAIYAAVTVLAALSVASERLVEIVKGSIPWLNKQNPDTSVEGFRQMALHVLAGISGMVTAWLSSSMDMMPYRLQGAGGYLILGLMVSGGSGFWNSILSYVKASKDTKEANVPDSSAQAVAVRVV